MTKNDDATATTSEISFPRYGGGVASCRSGFRESAPYSRTHHSHARFARELNSCPLEHGGVPSTVDYSAVVLYRIGDLFARYVHLVSVIDIPWVCSLIYYPEWEYVGVLPTFKGSNFINCSLK